MSVIAFESLDVTSINDALVVLDVDGTLTADGLETLSPAVLKKVFLLKKNNKVYLCSNRKNHSRNERVAKQTGTFYLKTKFKKPDRRIHQLIENPENKPLVVIGDKFLTDGLFAQRIGAQFIKVKRVVSREEPWWIKWVNACDDWVYKWYA